MKTRKLATVLAAAALTLAMSVASAMAFDFTISGYTNSLMVSPTETSSTSSGLPNTPTGLTVDENGGAGFYSINFSGGLGDFTNVSGLKGILTFSPDTAWDTTSRYYNSGVMRETFSATTTVNSNNETYFTLYANDAAMFSFGLDALTTGDPNFLSGYVNGTTPVLNAPYLFVNTGSLLDINNNDTLVSYGFVGFDGLSATDELGNNIDLVLANAAVTPTDMSPVPEPGTFLLFGGGLAGLAFWRRRKA